MLDLIPFAGGRRQMADGNAQASLGGKLLQLHLPQPVASPIGPAAISNNQEFLDWLDTGRSQCCATSV